VSSYSCSDWAEVRHFDVGSRFNDQRVLGNYRSLNLKRGESTATTAFGAEELDDDDPRVSGQKKNKNRRNRFGDFVSSMSTDGDTGGKKTRRASITYYVPSASSSSSPKYS